MCGQHSVANRICVSRLFNVHGAANRVFAAAIRANRGEAAPYYNTATPADPDGPKGQDVKPAVYGSAKTAKG